MGPLTRIQPKCMLDVNGKTLLARSAAQLSRIGCTSVVVVTGHQASAVRCPGVSVIHNRDYWRTEVAGSLLQARDSLKQGVVICYSDVWISRRTFDAAAASTSEISLIVDIDWRTAYVGRVWHPTSEAETVHYSDNGTVYRIGKQLRNPLLQGMNEGEFIGLLTASPDGADKILSCMKRIQKRGLVALNDGRVVRWGKAYLAHVLQALVDDGVRISAISVHGGWGEIDTVEDLLRVQSLVRNHEHQELHS